jgi:hypothetical protein
MANNNFYFDVNTGFTDSLTSLTEAFVTSLRVERPASVNAILNLISSRTPLNYEIKSLREWSIDFAFDLNTIHKMFKPVLNQTTSGSSAPYTHTFTPFTANSITLKAITFAVATPAVTKYYKLAMPETIRVDYSAGELAKFTVNGSAVASTSSKTLNPNSNALYVYPHMSSNFYINGTRYDCTEASVVLNTGFKPTYIIGNKEYRDFDTLEYNLSFNATFKTSSSMYDLTNADDVSFEISDGTYRILFTIFDTAKIYTKSIKAGDPDIIQIGGSNAQDFSIEVKNSVSS